MKHFFKIVGAVVAPLLLTGCLLIPGKFNSELKLMKDGAYSFAYTGEMQFFDPDNGGFGRKQSYAPFNEKGMECYNRIEKKTGEISPMDYDQYFRVSDTDYESHPYRFEKRDCSATEKTKERERHEKDLARRKKDEEEKMAVYGSIFGGAIPGNDARLKQFASELEKYDGWNKVKYLGNDKFEVEYAVSGRFDQNFTFPSFPGATLQFPFVQIIRRNGGELEILTPAMSGPGGLFGAMALGKMGGASNGPDLASIDGKFTIETDGEILSNNSADGYTQTEETRTMTWAVGGEPNPGEGPRAIVKLSR